MKLIRFINEADETKYGVQQEDGSVTYLEGCPFDSPTDTGETATVSKLLAPIAPKSIVCIGLNYKKHAEEGGSDMPEHPVVFMKMPSTVQNPGDSIQIPTHLPSTMVDYECELAVVIGKRAKNVSKENALDYVLGYTCANDVGRDWQ